MSEAKNTITCYISYSGFSEQYDTLTDFMNDLRKAEKTYLNFHRRKIKQKSEYNDKMSNNLKNSDIFILYLTSNCLSFDVSPLHELKYAQELYKPILVLKCPSVDKVRFQFDDDKK